LDHAFDLLLEKLAATSDYTSECIFVLDAHWCFRHLNRRAEQEIARGQDLLGTVIWDAFPGARDGDFGGRCAAAMQDQVPHQFEAYYAPLGGWYEVQASPACGGILVSFQNINERKEADKRLRDAEERYRLAALATNDLIYDWDIQAGRVQWNAVAGTRFGYDIGQLGSAIKWWEERIHPEDRANVDAHVQEVIRHRQERLDCRYRWQKADGSYAEVHDRGYLMTDATGLLVRVVGAMQDLTGERAAQADAVRARDLLQTVIDSVTDHIFVKDATGRFVLANQASQSKWDLIGHRAADIFGADAAAVLDQADRKVMADGALTIEERVPFCGETRIFQSLKVPWRQDGEIRGVIGISRDITDQKAIDEQVSWAANHDALTGLHNRASFQSSLARMISKAAIEGGQLAILHLDLDHFKEVNDTLGHDAGDALLQAFADRLQSCVRASDIVARFGGDEFAIILPGCGAAEALAVADKIIGSLRSPFIHEGRVLDCRTSIGASVFPTHGDNPQELFKNADMALYAAKAEGRGVARLFEPRLRDTLQKRVSMLSLGRDALRGRQIFPYYQPKIDLFTGEVAGFEALLRWHHPRFGVRSPGTIAACFDDFGLATEISDRMIDCALADMRAWLDQGLSFGSIALNAGAAEFRTGRFAESILEQLARSGVPTSRFQLEVTETVFLGAGAESVERDLKMLSSAGVRIALDDFGTGYASLRHLKQFPVDIIKIDRSFISEMQQRPDDAAIVSAIINLGQNLSLDVVAEGIEQADQERQLRQLGCGFGQGFLYSKAFPASQMETFLRQHADTQATRPPE
jgi:diguanylate cyclase (GGDEF)-like protein/PAS domain S-box-containing protein